MMNPDYPIYIPSKGRWDSRLTIKALTKIHVPFRVVIEPQEFDQYAEVIPAENILVLPFSNLGQGSIPASGLGDAIKQVMIITGLLMTIFMTSSLHQNIKYSVDSGAIFKAQDFVSSYENIALAGFNMNYSPRIQTKPLYSQYAFIPAFSSGMIYLTAGVENTMKILICHYGF
jgi:hypothetical protein